LLTAQAQSPLALGIHGAAATATMTYSFAVSGGSPGDVVPILLAASLITSGSDPSLGIGSATLRVDTSLAGGTAALVAVCTAGCGSAATSFSGVLAFSARSGDTGNQVVLQVQASVVGNGAAPESASASIDPYLFVDPSFPNASQYQIVVSPGVANLPLPEPTAAVLVAAGASAALRRRSRKG
jgi:hypothetical protein